MSWWWEAKTNIELKRHIRIHTDAKLYSCGHCCFRTLDQVKRHLLKSHSERTSLIFDTCRSGLKPFECTVCSKQFTLAGNLIRHSRIHTGDKPYKCSLCSICFSDSSNLPHHKHLVHSNKRPYHCPYCGKLFKTNTELKHHVHIHTDAKPYSCRH